MWLDAFVYLPLVILGIHRVMDLKTAETFIYQLFTLVFIQFLYGFYDWRLFFLYFIARLLTNWSEYKKTIVPYGITSLLAGGASMIIVLPAVLDLRSMARH